jgi:hypothetical protein
MPVDWTQTLSTLAATVVGGGITVAVTELSHRRQQRAAISAETRAREMKASDRAMEACKGLLELDLDPYAYGKSDRTPDQEADVRIRHREWANRREELKNLFQIAIADFSDPATALGSSIATARPGRRRPR